MARDAPVLERSQSKQILNISQATTIPHFTSINLFSNGEYDLTDPSTLLILQLLKEDEAKLLTGEIDDPHETEISNLCTMCELWQNETLQKRQNSDDRKLAISISNAIAADQNILTALQNEETQAQQDHELAIRINEDPNHVDRVLNRVTDQSPAQDITTESVCEVVSALGSLSMSQHDATETEELDTVLNADGANSRNCVSCLEPMKELPMYLPACDHRYCKDCLRELFLNATNDEGLYPPRCCNNIFPPGLAIRLLEYGELAAFGTKGVEFSCADRYYCADPACSVFIPPWLIKNERAQCPKCSRATHTACRALGEPNHECPSDEALQQVLALGENSSWRRCPRCKTMVELGRGCNHITCRCGAEFCYDCGATWRTCSCELWDEVNIVDVANRMADHEVAPEAPDEVRAEVVARAIQQLRAHADIPCEHDRQRQWRWRDWGDLECEVCFNTMRHYIFECKQCHIAACWYCRRNRLR